jgi:peptide/nickel transport system permease protein
MSVQRATRSERWKILRHSLTFWIGGGIVLMWIVFAVFGDFVTGYDPRGTPQDILNRLQPPSAEHWFGTDELGRDVLSRVLAGSRQVLMVSASATLLGTVAGTILGLLVGYFGGIFDDVVSRVLDAFLSIPLVITGMLAIAALGTTTVGVIVVIGVVFAPLIAKTVRAAVLSERQLDYVTAAQLRKDNRFYILFVEILPNVSGVITVEFTVRLGYAIFTVLALAFLGFGVEPGTPDWGLMIAQHRGHLIFDIWWPVFFPSLAIASLVVGVNLFADAVSEVMEQ